MTNVHSINTIFTRDKMKLASSTSEQNVYFTYVCLIKDNNMKQKDNLSYTGETYDLFGTSEEKSHDEPTIQVERTKALYELVDSKKKKDFSGCDVIKAETTAPYPTTSGEDSELSENDDQSYFIPCDNPNVLKLTKMKWLTEEQEGTPNSSSPSISATSSCSNWTDSKEDLGNKTLDDKYLSTILRLDKEHNMFGLSDFTLVETKPSKQKRKEDEKPVFPQTAIVQVCCAKRCCRNKSNTDLPTSLKCGSCVKCCIIPCVPVPCSRLCGPRPCDPCPSPPPCKPFCDCCSSGCSSCKIAGIPKCGTDCSSCFGLKLKINKKPVYDPPVVELTPRSSSVLQKPVAAISCHHIPHCVPPSSCFQYLMPCYWPARPAAPCSEPSRCFHNPPCPAPRRRQRVPFPPQYVCPKVCDVKGADKKPKCTNEVCPGNIAEMSKAIEERYGKGLSASSSTTVASNKSSKGNKSKKS